MTSPGVYVPTTFPLGYAFAQHRPWIMKSAAQFRPGPPPALTSALWARDYNEIKSVGSAASTVRTPEQTAIAQFWATALPDVHMGIVHSVALAKGREITRNARLYAAVTAALNDAEIAVLEAKYHYNFWRPITAIRNGDHRRQPRDRARSGLDAADCDATASGVSVRALRHCFDHRDRDSCRPRPRPTADLDEYQQHRTRCHSPVDTHRGRGEGGFRGPYSRWGAFPQFHRGRKPAWVYRWERSWRRRTDFANGSGSRHRWMRAARSLE